jgi:hypothetical protein
MNGAAGCKQAPGKEELEHLGIEPSLSGSRRIPSFPERSALERLIAQGGRVEAWLRPFQTR